MTGPLHSPCLYLVPTPIGNLGDITHRALQVLEQVEVIYAEDTRHTGILLQHYGIKANLKSLHMHNEAARIQSVLQQLEQGHAVALVSDAGTPLISDPGARLLPAVCAADFPVLPLPGACAAICALSASALPSDSFLFVGFIPARGAARSKRLQELQQVTATLIFYESCHRIEDFLHCAVQVFGRSRLACVARELTKHYESLQRGSLQQLYEQVQSGDIPSKGEFVLCIAGASVGPEGLVDKSLDAVLELLLPACSLKSAVHIAVQLTGQSKSQVYARALELRDATSR